ncbi:MAG TPA: Ig-like domain-containing protein [Gemmatimonadaceae bacterium]|nr:Ig-like domain-containing protein [Gemmatimonadaceae bacterium]
MIAACESAIDSPNHESTNISFQLDASSRRVALSVGQSRRLSVDGQSSNLRWTAQDTSVASVSELGIVDAKRPGKTTILVRAGSVVDSAVVIVRPPVAIVSLAADSIELGLGRVDRIQFLAFDSNGTRIDSIGGETVSWQTSAPSIAPIDSSGSLSGTALGVTMLFLRVGDHSDSAFVKVVAIPVQRVDIAGAETGSLTVGQSTQLHATARDQDGRELANRLFSWQSSNQGIVQVSPDGMIQAITPGVADITVSTEGVVSTTRVVALAYNGGQVSIGLPANIAVGDSAQASARITGAPSTAPITALWQSLNPSVASVSASGVVRGLSPGEARIRVTVLSTSAEGSLTVRGTAPTDSVTPKDSTPIPPTPAAGVALPQVFLATDVASTPSAGRTLRVAAGGSLQAALDSAVPGDRILVAAGARFNGNFVIRPKTGGIANGWITVQSDGTIPSEGVRAGPTSAAAFPKLVSTTVLPALSTAGPAARWRFIGLEFTNDPALTAVNGTVYLGASDAAQSSLSQVPTDIILDRVYVHSPDNTDDRRCVALNSARSAVIDSYIANCKSAFDAQAITGTNGPGPFKITNNYLEASGENIAFGGADPGIANLVPADIEIRHNHFFKPMAWKGSQWGANVKNLLELKVGRRVLIEGNVLENSWPAGQAGYAFVLWSVNQQGGCTACVTEHVTVQNNIIKNATSGFQLSAHYDQTPALPMNHVAIRNNVLIGIDNPTISAGAVSRLFTINDIIPQLAIEHNTGFGPDAGFVWGGAAPLPQHIIRNNLTGGGSYQIFTTYGAGSLAWGREAGPGSDFSGNVVALASDWLNVIPNNYYPQSMDAIGLAGGGQSASNPQASLDDLALTGESKFRGKATDGTDPGANIAAVRAATAGVEQRP